MRRNSELVTLVERADSESLKSLGFCYERKMNPAYYPQKKILENVFPRKIILSPESDDGKVNLANM